MSWSILLSLQFLRPGKNSLDFSYVYEDINIFIMYATFACGACLVPSFVPPKAPRPGPQKSFFLFRRQQWRGMAIRMNAAKAAKHNLLPLFSISLPTLGELAITLFSATHKFDNLYQT